MPPAWFFQAATLAYLPAAVGIADDMFLSGHDSTLLTRRVSVLHRGTAVFFFAPVAASADPYEPLYPPVSQGWPPDRPRRRLAS